MDAGSVERLLVILFRADQHLYNLLLLNAILDPIIYAVRIRELRRDYLAYLRRICLCCYRPDFKAIPHRVRWKSGRESGVAYIVVENGRVYRNVPRNSRLSCTSITTTKSRNHSSSNYSSGWGSGARCIATELDL